MKSYMMRNQNLTIIENKVVLIINRKIIVIEVLNQKVVANKILNKKTNGLKKIIVKINNKKNQFREVIQSKTLIVKNSIIHSINKT